MTDADEWADRILRSDLSLEEKGRLMAVYRMLRDGVPLAQLVATAPADQADNVIQLDAERRARDDDRQTIDLTACSAARTVRANGYETDDRET